MIMFLVLITLSFLFQYLNQGTIKDSHLDDLNDYKRMEESMDNVGFSAEEKSNIFRVVAAVMHLGNIAFEESEDAVGNNIRYKFEFSKSF